MFFVVMAAVLPTEGFLIVQSCPNCDVLFSFQRTHVLYKSKNVKSNVQIIFFEMFVHFYFHLKFDFVQGAWGSPQQEGFGALCLHNEHKTHACFF